MVMKRFEIKRPDPDGFWRINHENFVITAFRKSYFFQVAVPANEWDYETNRPAVHVRRMIYEQIRSLVGQSA